MTGASKTFLEYELTLKLEAHARHIQKQKLRGAKKTPESLETMGTPVPLYAIYLWIHLMLKYEQLCHLS